MTDVFELFERLAADAQSRAVGRCQLRKLLFEGFKPFEQRIVIAVGNFRSGFNVVKTVMSFDFGT